MIYTTEYLNKKFSLKDAIVNDEVDLIFGDSEEFLEEIAHIRNKENMQIIIRNLYEDQTDSHWFSMKFIPRRQIKGDTHGGKKGIPITFNKIVDGNDIKLSEWKVMLGGSKQSIAKSEQLQKQLNRIEKSFIDAVVEELGLLILEYWELNPNDRQQYNRMVEIRDQVQSRYFG